MKRILSLIFMLVIGILVYNSYFGSAEDKARGREVTTKAKDLGKTVIGLLKSERESFKEGKYDKALDKIGVVFKDIGQKAQELGGNFPERYNKIEKQLDDLKTKSDRQNTSQPTDPDREKKEIGDQFDKMINEIEALKRDMQANE